MDRAVHIRLRPLTIRPTGDPPVRIEIRVESPEERLIQFIIAATAKDNDF